MMQSRLGIRSMAGQMMVVLGVSFAVLLAALTAADLAEFGSVVDAARSDVTIDRVRRLRPALEHIEPAEMPAFLRRVSSCHEGYSMSDRPFVFLRTTSDMNEVAAKIGRALNLPARSVRAGYARLTAADFSYGSCAPGQIALPVEGAVISVALGGRWLHVEIHPHEWHFPSSMVERFRRSVLVFLLVAVIAITFIYRLGRPLGKLGQAARRFGSGLRVERLAEEGPVDVRRTIGAFNAMQEEVAQEVARRATVLAALSHDLRAPVTALRVKAELVEDEGAREGLIASIEKLEVIAASAIEFLKGESRSEPLRPVDLTALVESECADFEAAGADVRFESEEPLHCYCRPEALSRAVRNLIENAVKYGGSAKACVRRAGAAAKIVVADNGPGIPAGAYQNVLEPFVRLSSARERETGGFGLGLSVVKAVAEGHGGELILTPNSPSGLVATLCLPLSAADH